MKFIRRDWLKKVRILFVSSNKLHSVWLRFNKPYFYFLLFFFSGIVSQEDVTSVRDKYEKICEEAFELAKKETHIKYKDWLDSPWSGFFEGKDPLKVSPTGVKEETLTHIGNRFSSPPPNAAEFTIHRGLLRILAARKDMVDHQVADWALGEAMAFGTLLKEGIHVRLSGQDVERGTFSYYRDEIKWLRY